LAIWLPGVLVVVVLVMFPPGQSPPTKRNGVAKPLATPEMSRSRKVVGKPHTLRTFALNLLKVVRKFPALLRIVIDAIDKALIVFRVAQDTLANRGMLVSRGDRNAINRVFYVCGFHGGNILANAKFVNGQLPN
jgi:hypothetical protein